MFTHLIQTQKMCSQIDCLVPRFCHSSTSTKLNGKKAEFIWFRKASQKATKISSMTPFNMYGASQAVQPQLKIPADPRKGGGGMHRKAHIQTF